MSNIAKDATKGLRGLCSGPGVCPQCFKTGKRQEYIDQLRKDVEEGYGVIPREDWEKKKAELSEINFASWSGEDKPLHYRYQVGITKDGVFALQYEAKCDTCGFEFRKELVEQIQDGASLPAQPNGEPAVQSPPQSDGEAVQVPHG